MKKLLVGMCVFLGLVSVVNAGDVLGEDWDATFDVTYMTKYIWRGFSVFGSRGAIQPSLDLAHSSGFSANVWASYPIGSGYENSVEYDYTLAYSGSVLADEAWQTDYTVGWRYYDYISNASELYDMQEIFVEAEMPNVTGIEGLTPHLAWYQMMPATEASGMAGAGGPIFVMGINYDFVLADLPELPMTFVWDVVYNSGAGAVGVDHDWSHMVLGLATELKCPVTGGSFVPGIYYQNSWEESVNEDDQVWATFSYSLTF